MELKVEEVKALEPIKFNYEDIKGWVIEKAKEYKSVVYTEETMANAKSDRATLNKVSKAINDEKIRIKKEVLKPFEDFEKKCKELQGIITDASNSIDSQIKEFELKEQTEKEKQIKAVFDVYIRNYKDLISFDVIFNPRWLNKTYTMKKIEEEINGLIVKTADDMTTLEKYFNKEDKKVLDSTLAYYFPRVAESDVLNKAIQYGEGIIESNKKLEELKRVQEETKITQNITNNEEIQQIDFRVWATHTQLINLKNFLIENNIKYGKVD